MLKYLTQSELENNTDYETLLYIKNGSSYLIENIENIVVLDVKNTLSQYDNESFLTPESTDRSFVEIVCALISYHTHKSSQVNKIPDSVIKDYDNAMAMLAKYQTGELKIGAVNERLGEDSTFSSSVLIYGEQRQR